MTIWDIKLETATLQKLPSISLFTDICFYISEHFVKYFSATCCDSYPSQPQQLINQFVALQWHLKMIVRTLNEPVIDYTFKVHRIYAEQKITTVAASHVIKRLITLLSLPSIDSKLLLQILSQLLHNNLQLIQTILPVSSTKLFDACTQKVDEFIWELTCLITRGVPGPNSSLSNLDSVRMIIEINDGINQISIL